LPKNIVIARDELGFYSTMGFQSFQVALGWTYSWYGNLNLVGEIRERWENNIKQVGFEVLTAMSTKMAVFWVVAPCCLVDILPTFQRSLLPPSSGR
jgi:hypothetical protein